MAELPVDPTMATQIQETREALQRGFSLDADVLINEITTRQLPESVDALRWVAQLLPCLELCKVIYDRDLQEGHSGGIATIPSSYFGNVRGAVGNVVAALEKLRDFRFTGAASHDHYISVVQPLQSSIPNWFGMLVTTLGYLRRSEPDIKPELAALEHARSTTGQLQEETRGVIMQSREALEAAKAAALQAGIAAQGEEFRVAMRSYGREAKLWAWGALACAALILVGGFALLILKNEPPLAGESWTVAANLGYFGVRILIVSVVSFVMVVCVRNYRGAKHNEVMNAHRARALATFRQFTTGADAKVAQTVTLQAAEAVFAVQPSGFGEQGSVGSTHVAELVAATKEKE
jgi:hypothetical protein